MECQNPSAAVSVLGTPDYDLAGMRRAVRRHLDLLGVGEEISPEMRVVLKPNLLMKRRPEEVTTTHPSLVEAVVLELQAMGVEHITLADSPGGPYSLPLLEGIYRSSGMAGVAQRTGITLNTDLSFSPRHLAAGEACKDFNIITPLLEADYVINLCKVKTHGMTTMSGAVKNLFGAVPGLQKPELHFRFPQVEDFSNMLVDLSLLVAPNLTLVDGVVAMEGDGPSAGEARELGLTLAGRNLYTLDRALCAIMGIAPQQSPVMAQAIRRGLAPENLSVVEVVGDGLPAQPTPFRLPKSRGVDFVGYAPGFLRRPMELLRDRFLTPRPVIRTADCIGCGKCAESCPPQTIDLRDGKAVIRYSGCIRCYCCHEMCPVRAIDIRRTRFFDL